MIEWQRQGCLQYSLWWTIKPWPVALRFCPVEHSSGFDRSLHSSSQLHLPPGNNYFPRWFSTNYKFDHDWIHQRSMCYALKWGSDVPLLIVLLLNSSEEISPVQKPRKKIDQGQMKKSSSPDLFPLVFVDRSHLSQPNFFQFTTSSSLFHVLPSLSAIRSLIAALKRCFHFERKRHVRKMPKMSFLIQTCLLK